MQLTMAQCWSVVTNFVQGRTDYSNSELSLAANLALDDLTSKVEMRSLQSHTVSSSTSGTSALTFPTSCHYVTSVSNLSLGASDSRRTLHPCSIVDIDSASTELGIPVKYAIYREQLVLWPSADSAYSFQIRFQEKVPAVVDSVDTPNIDDRWHYPWALRTAAIAAAMRNDLDQSQFLQAQYLGQVSGTPTDAGLQQQAQPSRIKLVW